MDAVRELTADDIAALRAADSVVFRHRKGGGGEIVAHLDGGYSSDEPRIFTAKQQRLFPNHADTRDRTRERMIAVGSHVSGYTERGGGRSGDESSVAFAMIQSAQYSRHWPTIASLLKVGDAVRLGWVADNNNQYVTDAGLHVDRLDLVIERGDKKLVLPVASSVCADNSARMIRRQGW